MGKRNESEEEFSNFRQYRMPKRNRLTEFQLQEMEKELEKYRTEKETLFLNQKKIVLFDDGKWLKDKGGLSNDGSILIENFKPATYFPNGKLKENCDSKPVLWEQLQQDLEQFYSWKGRKEFREQKRIEGLETLANTLTIPNNW